MRQTKQTRPLTYSELAMFRNCRRSWWYRYRMQIGKPKHDESALHLGSAFHAFLECRHSPLSPLIALQAIPELLERLGPEVMPDGAANAHRAQLHALLSAYTAHYGKDNSDDPFVSVAVEKPFSLPIINPATGARSRTFHLAGVVDAVIRDRETGQLWMMEHKTAAMSSLTGGYFDKLKLDMQIHIYLYALSELYGEPVVGVLYNVAAKPTIKPYEVGKKRQEPEAYLDYAKRCLDWYAENIEQKLIRVPMYFNESALRSTQEEIWELAGQVRECDRRGRSACYMNTSQCFAWGRGCQYVDLCAARNEDGTDNQLILETCYTARPAHAELKKEVTD